MEPDWYHEHLEAVIEGRDRPFPGEEHLAPKWEEYDEWLAEIDVENQYDERQEAHSE